MMSDDVGGKGGGVICILVCMQFKTKHIPVGGNKNMKTLCSNFIVLLHLNPWY